MFRDFRSAYASLKSRNTGGGFLSDVTATTSQSVAPKKLPSFGKRVSRNNGAWVSF